MAKKATTIVLLIVVIFLLASTVYVSIILTSDNGTTPKQSKASEIDPSLQQASDEATPVDTTSSDAAQLAYANPSPTGGAEITSSPQSATDPANLDTSNLPETGLGQPTATPSGTVVTSTPTAALPSATMYPSPVVALQVSLTPSAAPTAMALLQPTSGAATSVPLPTALPVAGGETNTIIAVVIAGLTIAVAFLF